MTLDPQTLHTLQACLALRAATPPDAAKGELCALLAQQFLGIPYAANQLVGSATVPERLIIDFRGLDCFTLLDYVAALSVSNSVPTFIQNLIETRYADGEISFLQRKHFFSDWAWRGKALARDITARIGSLAVTVEKSLNQKADGSVYLAGLPVVARAITHIPGAEVDAGCISRLHSGDYIGIYTPLAGLDVTHVGILVHTAAGPVLRHASSHPNRHKVVDSPFIEYIRATPGIVVLRPE